MLRVKVIFLYCFSSLKNAFNFFAFIMLLATMTWTYWVLFFLIVVYGFHIWFLGRFFHEVMLNLVNYHSENKMDFIWRLKDIIYSAWFTSEKSQGAPCSVVELQEAARLRITRIYRKFCSRNCYFSMDQVCAMIQLQTWYLVVGDYIQKTQLNEQKLPIERI